MTQEIAPEKVVDMGTSTVPRPVPTEPPRRVRGKAGRVGLRYVLMIVLGLFLFAPFILSFFGSFKSNAEIIAYPPSLFPRGEWQVGELAALLRDRRWRRGAT